MKIDVTSPEGNTLVALGIATRALRRTGASDDDIGKLRHDVMKAVSANEARALIEEATHGAIEFFDPREGE